MKALLLLLALITTNAHAQKQVNRDAFMKHVRPVLNNILNDFYQMISLFPDFPKEIVPLVHELDTLGTEKEIMKDLCPSLITKACKKEIQGLRDKLLKVKMLSTSVMAKQKMPSSLYMNTISGYRLLAKFDKELEEAKGLLDNTSFLLTADIQQKRKTYDLIKELDELDTIISLAVVEYIPYHYKEDFRHFYFGFIHPVQVQIARNLNFEFMRRNIESLNFSLNLLNMNLTKRNKKTPDGMGPYLNLIHVRWNSLLRIYF